MSARDRHHPWFESPLTRARRRMRDISALDRRLTDDELVEYAACLNYVATGECKG